METSVWRIESTIWNSLQVLNAHATPHLQSMPVDPKLVDPTLRVYTTPLLHTHDGCNRTSLRVMSFNVPINTGDNHTLSEEWRKNLFQHRAPFVASLFSAYGLDVVALQELHQKQTTTILKMLNDNNETGSEETRAPEWGVVSCGREADGSSESQPIYYRQFQNYTQLCKLLALTFQCNYINS